MSKTEVLHNNYKFLQNIYFKEYEAVQQVSVVFFEYCVPRFTESATKLRKSLKK